MGRRQADEPGGASGKRRSIASAVSPRRDATPPARPVRQPRPPYPRDDDSDEYGDTSGYAAPYDADQPADDTPAVPFAPLLTLPTLPAIQTPPASYGAPDVSTGGRLRARQPAQPPAPNERAEDEWNWHSATNAHPATAYSPHVSSPGVSSSRMRSAAPATPLSSRMSGAHPIVHEGAGRAGYGEQAPPSRPSGKQRRVAPLDPDALPAIMPAPGNALTPVSAPTSAPLARRAANHARALDQSDVVLVPGRNLTRRLIPAPVRKTLARPTIRLLEFVQRRRVALIALLVLALATGLLVNVTGLGHAVSLLNGGAWRASADVTPLPTPLIAPDTLDAAHYVNKYGFDWPTNPQPIPGDEWNRLVYMLPYAILGANAADRKYNATIEPEMIVWWTHAEGIGGRINYSNCANQSVRPGANYFSDIENCNHSSFWQLGYGNQFSVIYVLKDAFTILYGDPNNAKLVQKVGQAVLNYDASQGTVPQCGGYSCTFPAMTIDQIVSGINEDTGMVTDDNWWASVLSRDPAINCYMIAYALEFFNHAATRNWVGCYYYEPCWGNESNKLGDILAAWPGLRKAAGLK